MEAVGEHAGAADAIGAWWDRADEAVHLEDGHLGPTGESNTSHSVANSTTTSGRNERSLAGQVCRHSAQPFSGWATCPSSRTTPGWSRHPSAAAPSIVTPGVSAVGQ